MGVKTKVKVKDIIKKYNMPVGKVIHELKEMGLVVSSASSDIEPDLVDFVYDHFKEVSIKEEKERIRLEIEKESDAKNEIHLKSPVIVKNLAEALGKKPNEIIGMLLTFNVLASINQTVETEVAKKLCKKFGMSLVVDRREKDEHVSKQEDHKPATPEEEMEEKDKPEDLVDRPPVVTFLGHVDHGKTSLQDAIRKTNVAAKESGGITQHIGASVVKVNGKTITFIDTPGHEAFTAMRARGAKATDIAILVVAADDGFMPQTVEALNHAKAAGVPVIVAINKMDLPGADSDKVIRQMQQNGLMSEEWGGEVGAIRVSAITGAGIDKLLDRIILEAEMLQLKANPKRAARGVVLEAQLEQGHGPTASVLVQTGILKRGDCVLCGKYYGKVKTMINAFGEPVENAGPSTPIKLVGLSGVPAAGATFIVCNEKEAKKIAEEREAESRTLGLEAENTAQGIGGTNLEDLMKRLEKGQKQILFIIIKADVQGSVEAISESLKKFPSDKIQIEVLHSGIGAITENDILLGAASSAIVVGFHVRVNPGVNSLAKKQKVEIRLYSIIYELIEDLKDALAGKLAPDQREKELGTAKIIKIFEISKGPKVCGCMVEKGLVRVGAKARVHRNNELIFNGAVQSLRRFQDDVKEVRQGLECGIRLDNFLDFQEGDLIQAYDIEYKKATL
ncbi:MAG: translation initiation factor IF-2 [Lentisphaerae bacterium]|nr:translation initiation factor IF-2 [Lentisphaerota bacterium]